MKRIIFALIIAIVGSVAITAVAADEKATPGITFSQTKVDFGNIHASAGKVTATYQFTNTGSEPLVIITVKPPMAGHDTPGIRDSELRDP